MQSLKKYFASKPPRPTAFLTPHNQITSERHFELLQSHKVSLSTQNAADIAVY